MSGEHGRLLVVDDHPTNRLKLAMAVRNLGHEAEIAEDGTRALEMMRAEQFDLILLDIVMPGLSGHDVLDEMRADPALRMLPVIVISASEEMADAIACIERGAEDYLPKPFDPVLLRARIGASLTKKRLNDSLRRKMDFIRGILGKFVPDIVVNQMVDSGGGLEPARLLATVMRTDVVGFTSIVEAHEPEHVFEMLNLYYQSLIEVMTRHRGVIKDFEGDALMTLFNVPIEDPEHADHALQAALEISALTETKTFSGISLRTRIGIATGEVIVGTVGDGARLAYTAVGNTANTAARLEQLNKERGTLVTVCGETLSRLRQSYPLDEPVSVSLRGLSDEIRISSLKQMEFW